MEKSIQTLPPIMLTVLESCRISPPPASVKKRSLPITFFDMIWLPHFPINQLFFYEFPHSRQHFMQKIIPNLKHSLSITLQHFFPFSSNLILFPNNSTKPEIRYVEGDSVAVTFAESSLDFSYLIGNHPRPCDMFYPLVPQLAPMVKESDFVTIPLFALQVTFFDTSGISIGITNQHVLCDASTKFDFLKAWTSISRHGLDETFLATRNLPFYDRVIKYPDCLDKMFINLPEVDTLISEYQPLQLLGGPTSKVRATFILTKEKINLVKQWVSIQLPTLGYISSFSVACAYMWSCLAKSCVEIEETKGDDELERFVCVANFRSRLDPPLPQTYFGNCVVPCVAIAKSVLLSENNGFLIAIESLGEAIRKTVNKKDGVLNDVEMWSDALFKMPTMIPSKIGVAGSPKLEIYELDFGWGKTKKYETVSIDCNGSITVNASKESPEDLEIGLSRPAKQMDAFIDIFNKGLDSFLRAGNI